MNCNHNRGCPFGQGYTGPPWNNGWNQPIQVSQPLPNEDILSYARRIKRELSDFEKEFKGDEKKKEPSKKTPSFTLLETAGLFMLAGPLVAIAYSKLYHYLMIIPQ